MKFFWYIFLQKSLTDGVWLYMSIRYYQFLKMFTKIMGFYELPWCFFWSCIRDLLIWKRCSFTKLLEKSYPKKCVHEEINCLYYIEILKHFRGDLSPGRTGDDLNDDLIWLPYLNSTTHYPNIREGHVHPDQVLYLDGGTLFVYLVISFCARRKYFVLPMLYFK